MPSVAIHPPKTPVTKGSHTKAKATLPNVCKMPGPPAPFVPSPLPNIAKSELSPKGYSTTVTIEGNAVAIRGATFESMGDMASKGTGGGLISANTHGPAKFITPGSMTVKIEGKSVHLLAEPMLNNCGPSGSPPNTGATMSGADHDELKGDDIRKELCKIIKQCEAEENAKARDNGGDPDSESWCDRNKLDLGEAKSKCAENKVNERKAEGKFGDDVKAEQPIDVTDARGNVTGGIRPDVIVGSPPNCSAVYDFKTSCPPRQGNNFEPSFPRYEFQTEFAGFSGGRPTYQIKFDRNMNPMKSDRFRKPPNMRHHGMTQDQIYRDVCGAECVAIHPQGRACSDT
jgi:uncharacterized Zn-binding protein involved in type VI secretion